MKKFISLIVITAMICCTSISFADTDNVKPSTPIINNQVEVDMVPMDNDQLDNQIENALKNVGDPAKKEKIVEYISMPVYETYDKKKGIEKNNEDVAKQIIELGKLSPSELDKKIAGDLTKIVNDSNVVSDMHITEEGLDLIKEYVPAQRDNIDTKKIADGPDMITIPQKNSKNRINTYKKSSPYRYLNTASGATLIKVRITVTWKAYATGGKRILTVSSVVNGTYNPKFWSPGPATSKTSKNGMFALHSVKAAFMHKKTGVIKHYNQGAKLYSNGKCTF